ncbi:DUF192 domain-containing protein [Poseidonocella sedimentorum]|uniref:DUF192 domain-containing protein n=1 Tax=Poseidonocella sedimentorum TaxID=871652 RepID=A0A1I6DFA6_9RHOB|nr:DUF192 domain-containing protein [Poseidonocella sedimentorum]SFR04139.1 hypothetical protein SAMN04515673_103123 [Poseidonocella sedimentorum]
MTWAAGAGIGLALLVGLAALPPSITPQRAAAQEHCAADAIEIRLPGRSARFTVELADTNAKRALGLMHREELAADTGMLFVYPKPQRAVFWMENTLIPLDMIFADSRGVVQRVHANARPLDRTTIDGGPGIQFVLEINGGLAAAQGITPGAQMRHPSIAQDRAAWPC